MKGFAIRKRQSSTEWQQEVTSGCVKIKRNRGNVRESDCEGLLDMV